MITIACYLGISTCSSGERVGERVGEIIDIRELYKDPNKEGYSAFTISLLYFLCCLAGRPEFFVAELNNCCFPSCSLDFFLYLIILSEISD